MKVVSISKSFSLVSLVSLVFQILALTLITNLVGISVARANNNSPSEAETSITLTLLGGSKLSGIVKGKTQNNIYLLVDDDIIVLSKEMLSPESWNVAYETKVWGVPESNPIASLGKTSLGKKSPTIANNAIPKRIKSSDSSELYVSSSFEPKESKDQVPIIIEK